MNSDMKRKLLYVILGALAIAGCSQFSDDSNPYDVTEAVKDVSGVWKLKSVTRNNIDITTDMDFSRFALHMGDDGRYHIENYLPFVVQKDGQWSTDNPHYPFRLSFLEDGAATSVDVDFRSPVVGGQRSLLITLSPGCASNVYTYTLERTEN
jgi:hypothetical protein